MESLVPEDQMPRVLHTIHMAVIGLVAGIILSAIYFWDEVLFAESIPLFIDLDRPPNSEIFSLGGMCILMSAALGMAFTLISYRLFAQQREDLSDLERLAFKGRGFWLARLTVGLAMTGLVTLGSWLFFLLIGNMFLNVQFSYVASVILCGVWSALVGGLVAYWMSGLTTTGLYILSALTMFVGLSTAFLLARNPEWWKRSLSYLGHDAGSNNVFNLSIISVGIIALALSSDLLNNLSILKRAGNFPQRNFTILQLGLPLLCAMVIGIGLFPTTISELSDTLHNISVHVLAILVVFSMLGIRWIIPENFPPLFATASLVLGVVSISLFVAWVVLSIINFVAFEIFLFITFMSWVFLLNRFTRQFIRNQNIEEVKQALKAHEENTVQANTT